jgi:hypothetical protein
LLNLNCWSKGFRLIIRNIFFNLTKETTPNPNWNVESYQRCIILFITLDLLSN